MLDVLRRHAAAASSVPAGIGTACLELLRVDGAAVLLMFDGGRRWQVAGAVGELTLELEEAQLTVAEGPAVEAYLTAGPVLIPDLRAMTGRWPGFADVVPEGIGALFALPLQLGAVRFGVLDMYARTATRWDSEQLGRALSFADFAAQALISGMETVPDNALGWLGGEPGHVPEIDQAAGMCSVQLGVPLTVAYARLRGFAFASDQSLAEVSRAVVSRRIRLHDDCSGEARGGR